LLLQQQQEARRNGEGSASSPTPPSPSSTAANVPPQLGSRDGGPGAANVNALAFIDPLNPSATHVIETLRDENASLRNRLADTERAYVRSARQNDLYKQELIDLRLFSLPSMLYLRFQYSQCLFLFRADDVKVFNGTTSLLRDKAVAGTKAV
jgi:hypothetical protein